MGDLFRIRGADKAAKGEGWAPPLIAVPKIQWASNPHCPTAIRARGYKTFFMLNSIEHEIFPPLINVKMPTIVGILTCMSGKK